MGLSWQQGPLATHPVGRFLTPDPLPERLLYAEPLRRRLRVRFDGDWIADSEDVVLLHEPGRYPVAYFPEPAIEPAVLVRDGDWVVADTERPRVLYESGFAPRWYVPRGDVDPDALAPDDRQTFCPYKGLASYYDIGGRARAAWSYEEAWPEVDRISNFVSFEPDKVDVYLDGMRLALEPGQTVVPHGIDRGFDVDEVDRGFDVDEVFATT